MHYNLPTSVYKKENLRKISEVCTTLVSKKYNNKMGLMFVVSGEWSVVSVLDTDTWGW